MAKIILVRHGTSQWEQENRLIGWADVPLLSNREGLQHIGNILLNQNSHIDVVITSVLERSIVSAWTIMNNMYHSWLPEIHDWRLNPRHYGVVQGLTHQEALLIYPNIDQITSSWDQKVATIDSTDSRHPSYDKRYANIPKEQLPSGESLQDVYIRVESLIEELVLPIVAKDQTILITAHHDSMKSIIRYFRKLSIEEMLKIDLALSQAIVLEYDINTQITTQHNLQ